MNIWRIKTSWRLELQITEKLNDTTTFITLQLSQSRSKITFYGYIDDRH